MDSIESLLAGKNISEPPEIKIVKEFVESKFKVTPQVSVNTKQIIIGVTSAALAGALRPLLPELQDKLDTKRKLLIRIQ